MNMVSGTHTQYAPQAWRVMIGPYSPPAYPEEAFREANSPRMRHAFSKNRVTGERQWAIGKNPFPSPIAHRL